MTVGSICTGRRAVLVSGGGPVRWQSRGGVAEAWQLGAAVSEVARKGGRSEQLSSASTGHSVLKFMLTQKVLYSALRNLNKYKSYNAYSTTASGGANYGLSPFKYYPGLDNEDDENREDGDSH